MHELKFYNGSENLDQKENIKNMCKAMLTEKFAREDYKELLELVVFYLGNDEEPKLRLRRPGAIHKARFMSKIINSIKIVMLSNKISSELGKNAVFSTRQLQRLERFVNFVVFVYIPWWMTAPVPSHAPSNDLALLKALKRYEGVDKVCAEAALHAFSNHLWYLTEDLILLCLFCSTTSNTVKEAIRIRLLQSDDIRGKSNRHGCAYGKPKMPELTEEHFEGSEFNFVTARSNIFFEIMKLDKDFLEKPVSSWPSDKSYLKAKTVVNSLLVVNDASERGVKLTQDFLGRAVQERKFQNLLQVVENNRREIPNLRVLPKSSDFDFEGF